jgi:ribosomal protein L29
MFKDFQKMNNDDLQKALKEKREALLNVRFSLSGSRTRKTSEARTIKREVAQIMSLLNKTN